MRRLASLVLVASTVALAVDPLLEPFTQPGQFTALKGKHSSPRFSSGTLEGVGPFVRNTWSSDLSGLVYGISLMDFRPADFAKRPAPQWLRETKEQLLSQLGLQLDSEKEVSSGHGKGLELVAVSKNRLEHLAARIYVADARVIVLTVYGFGAPGVAADFLEAFKIIGPQKAFVVDDAPPPPPPREAPTATTEPAAKLPADGVELRDPKSDDTGPGAYRYPTDPAYAAGSFDLLRVRITPAGDDVTFELEVAAPLADTWKLGTGFSLQHAVVFLDTDGNPRNGAGVGLPGQNVAFAPGHGWDRAVLLTPHGAERARKEVEQKAASLAKSVVIPNEVRGEGRVIKAVVPRKALGAGKPRAWRYQVVLGSQDGFPAPNSVLVRKVNEEVGPHRFGGGSDADCDPHVLDVIAGLAVGATSEAATQRELLQYECSEDGQAKKPATLQLIKP